MKFFFKCMFWLGLCVFPGALCAQGTTDVVVLGQNKGAVDSISSNGSLYLDVQKTARKLGIGVEQFAQSKQAKVSMKGFYAILSAPLTEIIVNAQTVKLQNPVIAYRGKIMAPAEFFTLPALQTALDRTVFFEDGKMRVEKRYDLSYEKNLAGKDFSAVLFSVKNGVTFKTQTPNKHTAVVTFPGATLKRDLFLRVKNGFIRSVEISQRGAQDPALKVILDKNAKAWNMYAEDGKLVFKAGVSKAAVSPAVAALPAPSVSAPAPKPQTAPALTKEDEAAKDAREQVFGDGPKISAPSGVLKPSLLSGADEEAVPSVPVLKPAPAAEISSAQPARKKMRIMLDPGHGGKDAGAVRKGYKEKNWNLDVSKELYQLLKKGGFEVKMTRSDDTFIPLSNRSKMANDFKADLFVSVHTNAAKNTAANGFQVYFRSEKATDKEAADVASFENEALQYEEVHYNFVDALLQSLAKTEYVNESSKLAGYIRNAVYKQPGIGIAVSGNNSVRQANFYVLKGVNSPAVLIEMGYISSAKDRARLSNKTVQKKMAQGIYNGVRDYAKKEGWTN